ncbi:MAG: Fic family protein [Alphaproteobacteria bacterium]|nr:MAG: Fic family protein [Alphaproteobacteria bacterium]
MIWNWQQEDWPKFSYDKASLEEAEGAFLRQSGILQGSYKHIGDADKTVLTVDLMSDEAYKTSEIEGEILDRASLHSSIRRHFGLDSDKGKIPPAERGIADMMIDLYRHFADPLTHETLFDWHTRIMSGRTNLKDIGRYRTHQEPMQVVSGAIYKPKIHFEAPPSKAMTREMTRFISWFNKTAPGGAMPLSALTRAGIAHLYFVCIHPFEDGNGRIARGLAEKALAQSLGQPSLIALSHTIQQRKKAYYDALERNNKDNQIDDWLAYFSKTILTAQAYTQATVDFLIEKTKLYDKVRGALNIRQEKALARIFREGIEGFKGGLSAENYITITGAPRATVTRDLRDLVEKGVLIRTGERKSTRYWLNSAHVKSKRS